MCVEFKRHLVVTPKGMIYFFPAERESGGKGYLVGSRYSTNRVNLDHPKVSENGINPGRQGLRSAQTSAYRNLPRFVHRQMSHSTRTSQVWEVAERPNELQNPAGSLTVAK